MLLYTLLYLLSKNLWLISWVIFFVLLYLLVKYLWVFIWVLFILTVLEAWHNNRERVEKIRKSDGSEKREAISKWILLWAIPFVSLLVAIGSQIGADRADKWINSMELKVKQNDPTNRPVAPMNSRAIVEFWTRGTRHCDFPKPSYYATTNYAAIVDPTDRRIYLACGLLEKYSGGYPPYYLKLGNTTSDGTNTEWHFLLAQDSFYIPPTNEPAGSISNWNVFEFVDCSIPPMAEILKGKITVVANFETREIEIPHQMAKSFTNDWPQFHRNPQLNVTIFGQ